MAHDEGKGRHISPSLRKLLTVTNPDGSPLENQTTQPSKPPSELLSRLDAFLPRLAQANASLTTSASGPTPDVIETLLKPNAPPVRTEANAADFLKPVSLPGANSSPTPREENNEKQMEQGCQQDTHAEGSEATAVEMHLFVDNSLGDLVPSNDATTPDVSQESPADDSLIREISSTTLPNSSATPSASPSTTASPSA